MTDHYRWAVWDHDPEPGQVPNAAERGVSLLIDREALGAVVETDRRDDSRAGDRSQIIESAVALTGGWRVRRVRHR